jgi:hypothetical protein
LHNVTASVLGNLTFGQNFLHLALFYFSHPLSSLSSLDSLHQYFLFLDCLSLSFFLRGFFSLRSLRRLRNQPDKLLFYPFWELEIFLDSKEAILCFGTDFNFEKHFIGCWFLQKRS